MLIAPSILSVKEKDYEMIFKKLEELQVSMLHLDIMDGNFVKNKTYDYKMVEKIKKQTSLVLDTHLMITNPEAHVLDYILAGSAFITFHYETTNNPARLIKMIKSNHASCGISIKPFLNPQVLKPYLKDLDLILIMSVEPGKGGQQFMMNALKKVEYLAMMREKYGYHYIIEVDGGINSENAQLLKAKGADVIVVGTYLMNSSNINNTYQELRNI